MASAARPRVPKSLGVRTSPAPKWCIQTRLTITRAVSGLAGSAIAWASSSRPLPSANGLRSSPARTARNCRGTSAPCVAGLPRWKTRGVGRVGAIDQDDGVRRARPATGSASGRRPPAASTAPRRRWSGRTTRCSRSARRAPRRASRRRTGRCAMPRGQRRFRERHGQPARRCAEPTPPAASRLARTGRRTVGDLAHVARAAWRTPAATSGLTSPGARRQLRDDLRRACGELVGRAVARRRARARRPDRGASRRGPGSRCQRRTVAGMRSLGVEDLVEALLGILVQLQLGGQVVADPRPHRGPRPPLAASPCTSASFFCRFASSSSNVGVLDRRGGSRRHQPLRAAAEDAVERVVVARSGSGRTCGRGSGRSATVRPSSAAGDDVDAVVDDVVRRARGTAGRASGSPSPPAAGGRRRRRAGRRRAAATRKRS